MTYRQKWSVPRRRESNRLTFYKTLFARMGNIKAGKYVSDEGEDLNDVEKVLGKNGINLRDQTNEFRNFGDVLDEVASKWEDYDSVTKRAIATSFAGTRQQEKFFVLMENYGQALEYEAVAANAAGTANRKYTEAYLDSIEARKNAMKAAFESLSQTVLNSDLIKTIFSIITRLISLLDKFLQSAVGKLVTGATIATSIVKIIKWLPGILTTISTKLFDITGKFLNVQKSAERTAAAIKNMGSLLSSVIIGASITVSAFDAIQTIIDNSKDNEKRQENERIASEWESRSEDAANLNNLVKEYNELDSTSERYLAVESDIVGLLGDKAKTLGGLKAGTQEYREEVEKLAEAEKAANVEGLSRAAAAAFGNIESSDMGYVAGTKWWNKGFAAPRLWQWKREWNIEGPSFVNANGETRNSEYSIYRILDRAGIGVGERLGGVDYLKGITNGSSVSDRLNDYAIYASALAALDNWAKNGEGGWTPSDKTRSQLFNSGGYKDISTAVQQGSGIETAIQRYVELYTMQNADGTIRGLLEYLQGIFDYDFSSNGFYTSKIGEWFELFTKKETSDSIKTVAESFESLFDTLTGSDLAGATGAVETLASAIEEMDGSGKISLETAEKLAELGEEYVEAISIENGELRVNTDLLRGMAAQKYEAAKAAAIANGATQKTIDLYDVLIQKTKELGSGDALTRANSLLDYENAILEFAGGADYNQRRLTNTSRQRENVLKQIEYLRAHGYSSDSDEIMSLYKQYIEYTERMISLNKEFASQEEDDIKSAIEAENDELEKQKDLFDDIINARKKALDLMKEENSYQKELAEKQKAVGDLQTQLAAARLDTSASGRARVRQLEEQLASAQSDLDDFNLEHAVDVISDRMDAEKEENEALYEKQKADNDARLDALIAENKANLEQYGTYLKEEVDIVHDALGNIDVDINDPETGIANTLTDIEGVIQKIEDKIGNDNTALPFSSTGIDPIMAGMASVIASAVSSTSAGDIYPLTKDQITELKIRMNKRKYHSGGIVDDLGLGDNEVFAKLMKGEYVATPAQMSNFLRKTLPSMTAAGGQHFNAPLIAVNCESVNEESLPKLETIIKSAADRIKAELTSAFDKTGFRSPNKRILAY